MSSASIKLSDIEEIDIDVKEIMNYKLSLPIGKIMIDP
jgi:hypothetical protein